MIGIPAPGRLLDSRPLATHRLPPTRRESAMPHRSRPERHANNGMAALRSIVASLHFAVSVSAIRLPIASRPLDLGIENRWSANDLCAMRRAGAAIVVTMIFGIATARAATPAVQLVALARGLVPLVSRDSLGPGDLAVHRCGVFPTYPCISTFFALSRARSPKGRIALLRTQARRAGWRVTALKPFGTGLALELTRERFHARYAIARDAGPASTIVGLDVFGSADVPLTPSAVQRRAWSHEKRRFVKQADVICAATIGRVTKGAQLRPAVAAAIRRLGALAPPAGEVSRVQSF